MAQTAWWSMTSFPWPGVAIWYIAYFRIEAPYKLLVCCYIHLPAFIPQIHIWYWFWAKHWPRRWDCSGEQGKHNSCPMALSEGRYLGRIDYLLLGHLRHTQFSHSWYSKFMGPTSLANHRSSPPWSLWPDLAHNSHEVPLGPMEAILSKLWCREENWVHLVPLLLCLFRDYVL